jgi:hypothetical protein
MSETDEVERALLVEQRQQWSQSSPRLIDALRYACTSLSQPCLSSTRFRLNYWQNLSLNKQLEQAN